MSNQYSGTMLFAHVLLIQGSIWENTQEAKKQVLNLPKLKKSKELRKNKDMTIKLHVWKRERKGKEKWKIKESVKSNRESQQ